MVNLSTALGLGIFMSALSVSIVLYFIDRTERVNLTLPYGSASLPYTIAVIGAGIFAFAQAGIIGVASALATAIFFGAIIKFTNKVKTETEGE